MFLKNGTDVHFRMSRSKKWKPVTHPSITLSGRIPHSSYPCIKGIMPGGRSSADACSTMQSHSQGIPRRGTSSAACALSTDGRGIGNPLSSSMGSSGWQRFRSCSSPWRRRRENSIRRYRETCRRQSLTHSYSWVHLPVSACRSCGSISETTMII